MAKNIAVYGTLRVGRGNNGLMSGMKHIGQGLTVEKYEMTASGIPFLNKKKPTSRITVDVFEVTDERLPHIDALEGYDPNNHEKSWYKREPVEVEFNDGKKITAEIYFNDDIGRDLIESGDYVKN